MVASVGKDNLLAGLAAKALGALPPTAPSTAPVQPALPGLPGLPTLTPQTAPDVPAPPPALPPIPPPVAPPAVPALLPGITPEMIAALQAQGLLAPTPPPAPAPVVTIGGPVQMTTTAPTLQGFNAPPPAPTFTPPPGDFPSLPVPPPQEKRKPGRPPGSKNKSQTMAPAQVSAPILGAPPVAPQVLTPAEHAGIGAGGGDDKDGKPIGTLFINALPVGESFESVNAYYQEAHKELLEKAGGHYKHIEFGKGPALFAICVGEAIERNPPPSGYLFVDSRTPEGADVLETLVALADQVVRGV